MKLDIYVLRNKTSMKHYINYTSKMANNGETYGTLYIKVLPTN
jgi:hypothetical protein